MPPLELLFFGGFEARLAGQLLAGFESDKVRLLLAYLALAPGKTHRRESLAGLFWPESSEQRARQSLTQALYNLRQVLDQASQADCLEVSRNDVSFHLGEGLQVDVTRFLALVKQISAHPHPVAWACRSCITRLAEAADLYRGELLAGCSLPDAEAFEDWLRQQREHLHGQALKILADLSHSSQKRGRLDQALAYAARLAALDRFDEANQRQWWRLLAQAGQAAEASKQYKSLQRLLWAELGVQPEPQTVTTFEQIRRGPTAAAAPVQPPINLPAAMTNFVGRVEELETLSWQLVDPNCRLVTILGLGGAGKTRLALEAGRVLALAFTDGVFWVDTGVLNSPQDILSVLVRTVGARLERPPGESQPAALETALLDYLRPKECLLILDGAEMVLEGVVALVKLLKDAPGVKVLVTSRARLNLSWEHLLALEGLPAPIDASPGWQESPAIQLFCETARRGRPDFILSVENAADVRQICAVLQGMPLAIVLAAAWTSAMPPGAILCEIRTNLDSLQSSWSDLPPRQHSLRAAFTYSWELLWAEEQALLRQLSIFRQPFTLEAVLAVAELPAPGAFDGNTAQQKLTTLIHFSLVQRAGAERLRLHDLVRQYAQEKLLEDPQESQQVRQRFTTLYLRKLAAWGKDLKCSQKPQALAEMDLEIENARLAWDWAVDQAQPAELAGALEGLCWYADSRRQFHSGESACALALNRLGGGGMDLGSIRMWARLSSWQAYFWIALGRRAEGLGRLEQVLLELSKVQFSELDTRWEQAQALYFKSALLARRDNLHALQSALHSADLFRSLGDAWYTSFALRWAAVALESLDRHREQIELAEQALDLQTPHGDPELVGNLLYVLGCGYLFVGQVEKGIGIIRDSDRYFYQLDATKMLYDTSFNASVTLLWSGEYLAALRQIELHRLTCQESKLPFSGVLNVGVVWAYWGLGRYTEALDAAPSAGVGALVLTGAIRLLQDQPELARLDFDNALKGGASVTDRLFAAYAYAFLSIACYRLGELEQARANLRLALQTAFQGNALGFSASLLAVAFYLLERGFIELALETYTTAIKLPGFRKSAWVQDFIGARLEQVAHTLPEAVAEAARQRGQAHDPQAQAAEWLEKIDFLFTW